MRIMRTHMRKRPFFMRPHICDHLKRLTFAETLVVRAIFKYACYTLLAKNVDFQTISHLLLLEILNISLNPSSYKKFVEPLIWIYKQLLLRVWEFSKKFYISFLHRRSFDLSVCSSVCWTVCHYFLKGWECSYQRSW